MAIDTKKIMEEVRLNLSRLQRCDGPHDFSIDKTPTRCLGKRWECTKCGGDVDQLHKSWYERGLAHGRKDHSGRGGGTRENNNSEPAAGGSESNLTNTKNMHDHTGLPLKQGDKILIPAVIREVSTSPNFCNVTVETTLPGLAGESPAAVTLNTRQLLMAGPRPAGLLPFIEKPEELTSEQATAQRILEGKGLRLELSAFVDFLKRSPNGTPERTLALRHLQQARHWLGEDLALAGAPYPYPRGQDTTTTVVDPPADVLPGIAAATPAPSGFAPAAPPPETPAPAAAGPVADAAPAPEPAAAPAGEPINGNPVAAAPTTN